MIQYGKLKLYEKLDYPSHTYTTSEINDDIIKLFKKVNFAEKSRSSNYVFEDWVKKKTVAYTVTLVEEQPVLGSLVWSRPMYNKMARLCTRYCIDPAWAHINFGKGTDGMRLDTMDHITQQIELCTKLGYKDFFIGREDKSAGRRSDKIARQMKKYTNIDWKCSDKEVLTCLDPANDQCWQYILYNNRKDFDYESELST